MSYLKNVAGDQLKEYTGTTTSAVYSYSKNGNTVNQALCAINGDSGTVLVKQRIKGESTFRDLLSIDLTAQQGNLNFITSCGTYIEYEVEITGGVNVSVVIVGAKEVA